MGGWLDRWAKRAATAAPIDVSAHEVTPSDGAEASSLLSRRDFLKKAGIVGGVAWSVPVIADRRRSHGFRLTEHTARWCVQRLGPCNGGHAFCNGATCGGLAALCPADVCGAGSGLQQPDRTRRHMRWPRCNLQWRSADCQYGNCTRTCAFAEWFRCSLYHRNGDSDCLVPMRLHLPTERCRHPLPSVARRLCHSTLT